MMMNKNKGKCVFGEDERYTDVCACECLTLFGTCRPENITDNSDEICKPSLEQYRATIKPKVKAQIQKGNNKRKRDVNKNHPLKK